jgi:two-component system, NarL family, response regulator DevR
MNKVLLVDDHASFREMLCFVFEREPDFEVVAYAGSLAEAHSMLDGIDLAVVDLDLPDGDGTRLIDTLFSVNPHAVVLVLTASPDREAHARVVQAGAAGVLHKSARVKDIIDAARRLTAGESILSVNEVFELLRLAGRLQERDHKSKQTIERLTPREREILGALGDGLSDKQIAECLGVSVGTVGNHFMNIFKKLGVHSRLQALLFALRHGIVDVDEAKYR